MLRIDAHQHFWIYDDMEHAWMTEEMHLIKRNFLPVDLKPLLELNNIDGTVLVQVTQSEEETLTLLNIAETNDFVRGVVGWVDLRDKNIRGRLEGYKKYPALKGFRHVLQTEEPGFMLQPEFLNGISALREFDYTYDILIYPRHLEAAERLVNKFAGQRFVVDHLAKPEIKRKNIVEWEKGIRLLASYPNVWCKISGMVTEAAWANWKPDEFEIYMDVILNAFGVKKVMFGSDWPMCLVAASYQDVLNIATKYFSSFSADEQQLFFGGNAINFYQLQ